MVRKVIIIGGGAAGLAAGVGLVSRGMDVTIFEGRPFLGGRLYSFLDPETGDVIDNGQHLLGGFYYRTFELLSKIGMGASVERQRQLEVKFIKGSGSKYWFRVPRVKMPYGFALGLLEYSKFPKWSLLRLLANNKKIKKAPLPGQTADAWLRGLGQSGGAISNFFRPLILATLNAEPEVVAAVLFQQMLQTILESREGDAVLAYSKVGLSQLVAEPAAKYIKSKGGKILLLNKIKSLNLEGGGIKSVTDDTGKEITADVYISAVPPDALAKIIPEGIVENLDVFEYSPIVSVDIWFETSVMKDIMMGFLDGPFHWCFDKSKIFGSVGRYPYVSMIVSAANKEILLDKAVLIKMAVDEVRKKFRWCSQAAVLHARVIKEKKATVLLTPEANSKRPGTRTGLDNFYLAGDWVNTGLPATIESAVVSGFGAADLIS